MIFAVRGWSARLAGLAGVAWGLVVWAFGEAFGGIFAPGLTVLFGAPGAVLIYVVAGRAARAARARLGVTADRPADCSAGRARSSSAWRCSRPGRDAASGRARCTGRPSGAGRHDPVHGGHVAAARARVARLRRSANFTAAHGFAVNLVAVIALAAIGAGLSRRAPCAPTRGWRGSRSSPRAVFCLADWVLIEDLGFFGGLGTDPNS